MNTYPYSFQLHEPTKKQFWIASYLALLGHMSPEEAEQAADKALEICDSRWKEPEWVRDWDYRHNYPVGHHFTAAPVKASPEGVHRPPGHQDQDQT